MLSQSYIAIQQFKSKISQVRNTEELREALKSAQVTLSSRLESSLPWAVYWDVLEDSMVGNCLLSVYPRLYSGGEIYEATHSEKLNAFKGYSGFNDLEVQLLEALKRSVQTVQRVFH